MSMKLVCTIGTQVFSDGRVFQRGDVYEVDDETASTAISQGYATKYVEHVVAEPEVVEVPGTTKKPRKVTKRIGGR